MIEVKFIKCNENAQIPTYAHESDAGMDIYAIQSDIIKSGEYKIIPSGLKCEMPDNYEMQIRPRSGLAAKFGVTVLNAPGTVDAGYRGEIGVILINHGKQDFVIEKGMRIAQMVFAQIAKVSVCEVRNLSDTDRGSGGYGSSGIK